MVHYLGGVLQKMACRQNIPPSPMISLGGGANFRFKTLQLVKIFQHLIWKLIQGSNFAFGHGKKQVNDFIVKIFPKQFGWN